LYKYKAVCDFVEGAIALGASVKNVVNLTVGTIYSTLPTEDDKEKFEINVSAEEMAKLVKYVDDGKINVTLAQMTLNKMLQEGKPVSDYIKPEDIAGISDEELTAICQRAIDENPKIIEDFKGGKDKAICGLYGYIKKATQGKANIQKADAIIRQLIK
jgi:aspartyl-tRNA(Asn)/glutamyl-tRNA(Gln) amidotransferase subunit B